MSDHQKPLFTDINADEAVENATEIDSLCMNCYEKVSTISEYKLKQKYMHNPYFLGQDATVINKNPFLQRISFNVIQLRTLRLRE